MYFECLRNHAKWRIWLLWVKKKYIEFFRGNYKELNSVVPTTPTFWMRSYSHSIKAVSHRVVYASLRMHSSRRGRRGGRGGVMSSAPSVGNISPGGCVTAMTAEVLLTRWFSFAWQKFVILFVYRIKNHVMFLNASFDCSSIELFVNRPRTPNMADITYNWETNSKTTPYLTDFPEQVRRGWFRSVEPDTIVTCENQSGAYIWMNGSANCRIVDNRGVYEWYFTIIAIGK